MKLRDLKGPPTKSGHRTNSLGSAKVDCHTCLKLGNCCDRQRPRCGTCTKNQRECGGFTMNLVWKDSKRSSESLLSRTGESEHVDSSNNESRAKDVSERQFKFVQGRRRIKRKPQLRRELQDHPIVNDGGNFTISSDDFLVMDANNWAPNATSGFGDGSPSESSSTEMISHGNEAGAFASSDIAAHTPWPHAHFFASYPNLMETDVESASPDQVDSSEELFQEDLDTLAHIIDVQLLAIPDDALTESDANMLTHAEQNLFEQFPLTSGIQFRNLAHKFDSILTLYNQEFCVLPLTTDCRTNPFRIPENGCEGSEFLTHAILAISSHHLSKKDNSLVLKANIHDHQSMAISLFSKALFRSSLTKLLDTLLILVNFQATQSAFGSWNVHLMGAQKILEGMGVTEICNMSPRVMAQVAILVWWDVTIALISRREPLLPEAYLQTLSEYDRNKMEGWTFFNLNGCPAELAVAMRRLAKLASIYEKASRMEWTTFNTTPVDIVAKEVMQWKNDEDITVNEAAYVEDDIDGRRNRFHCVEAWRYAILLYARRVFVQRQDASGLRSINYLARETLDHVRCIPRTAIVQKQVLLPVFLAGAEAGDGSVRDFVRDYCSYWSVKSGHLMFNTVATLLESIWAEWELSSRDVYWWGVKVNNTTFSPMSGEQLPVSELLLG